MAICNRFIDAKATDKIMAGIGFRTGVTLTTIIPQSLPGQDGTKINSSAARLLRVNLSRTTKTKRAMNQAKSIPRFTGQFDRMRG